LLYCAFQKAVLGENTGREKTKKRERKMNEETR
jgi:hypothetical protein